MDASTSNSDKNRQTVMTTISGNLGRLYRSQCRPDFFLSKILKPKENRHKIQKCVSWNASSLLLKLKVATIRSAIGGESNSACGLLEADDFLLFLATRLKYDLGKPNEFPPQAVARKAFARKKRKKGSLNHKKVRVSSRIG